MDSIRRWDSIKGIDEPLGGIHATFDDYKLVLILYYSGWGEPGDRDIKVTFEYAHSVLIQDENSPSRLTNGDAPNLGKGKYSAYWFPCLIIDDSSWLSTFEDWHLGFSRESYLHYLFVSGSNNVNVLSDGPPAVQWIDAFRDIPASWKEPSDRLFYKKIDWESGPEPCLEKGCDRLTIVRGDRCKIHHFIEVKGYDPKILEAE